MIQFIVINTLSHTISSCIFLMNMFCEYKSKWKMETLAGLHKFLNLGVKILKDWRKLQERSTADIKAVWLNCIT